jgi:RND family efflux transporter MFP subunit
VDAPDAAAPASASGAIVIRHCTLEYEHASSVAAPHLGVLQECLVRPGDRVKAGQVLGRIQDQDVRAELELRSAEAKSDVSVRLSQARYDHEVAKLKASTALRTRNFTSEEQYQVYKLAADSAALDLEEARHRYGLAQIQKRQADVAVRLREIVSPHNGVVVAVYKQPGEMVNVSERSGYAIFRVVDVDRLRVAGQLDVVDAWRVRAGQPVRVWADIGGVDLPIEREEFSGRVVFIDPEVKPETQTCKVVAEVDNRSGQLRAGLEARMEIRPEPVDEKTASRPSPPGSRQPEAVLSARAKPADDHPETLPPRPQR